MGRLTGQARSLTRLTHEFCPSGQVRYLSSSVASLAGLVVFEGISGRLPQDETSRQDRPKSKTRVSCWLPMHSVLQRTAQVCHRTLRLTANGCLRFVERT